MWVINVQRKSCLIIDSPGLVDFAIGLLKSVLNVSDRQMNYFLGNSDYRRTVINPAHQNFFQTQINSFPTKDA